MRALTAVRYPIPVRTNLLVAVLATMVSLACLWTASHDQAWWSIGLACVLFSYSNNTIFSLQHEAVHHNFHPDARINDAAGVLLAAWFPTIFSVQRISHFGHHRRNRSDEELYDYVLPHQSWWLKSYWIYCLLTGFYWAIIPLAMGVYLLCPWAFGSTWFQDGPARWWGFRPFVLDIARAPIRRVWLEGVMSLTWQLLLIQALDLSLVGWLMCYWSFGLNWSSVQYSDHAGSPRDVIEGAWNLHFWPFARWTFLNYNFHLAHHRQPDVPWIHLPGLVRQGDARPSFWAIYLRLWLGARPAPVGPGPAPHNELDT
jgi:fatty acid desaturase